MPKESFSCIASTRLAEDWADGHQLFPEGKELAAKTVPLVDDHGELKAS